MSYDITFVQESDYLHATIRGTNSRETVMNYMAEVLKECQKLDCFRVLIEECLEGPRLQGMEVFSISSEGSMEVLGIFDAIAYVDEQMGEMRNFVETVAINRGLPIGAFATVQEAKAWLAAQQPGIDDSNIFRGKDPADDS